ncbi:2,4-dichlorophenol 6-monooxygenase [Fusarium bulbicola]|nr:2,4-dichlorophenol 6-monooxygenase [Fusarium bulbicola]
MVTTTNSPSTRVDSHSSQLPEVETEVLIVGAGVSGLSFTAMLAALGIKVFAIAKHSGTAPAPRAHVTNQRTMEIFRDMGIEELIQAAGTCMPEIGSMVMATSLTGMEIGRYSCYGGGDHQLTDFAKASPSKMWNTPQNNMEPILLHRAREKGADIRFYHELIDIQQSEEAVVARVRERTSQGEYIVRARYAVGADGARSIVAQKTGFRFVGEPGLMHMIISWVEMDLAQYVAHRPACIYLMLQPGDAYWYNAADGEPDMSDEAINAHARSALAIPDSLPIRVKHKGKWQVNHVEATEYRHGRIFLAGDAAHRHPPASGLGSNACVQDAYNLSWKLAAVIKRQAGEGILESYNQERQPIGKQIVDHAIETLHDMALLPGALGFERGQSRQDGFAKLEELFSDADGASERREFLRKTIDRGIRRSNPLGVHLGHRYANSVAVVDDGTPFPEYDQDPVLFYHPTTHPGAYVPHAWIELNQKRISVLDNFEHGSFGLVVGIGGKPWEEAAAVVSKELGVKLPVYFVGQGCTCADVLAEWTNRREISDRGALLVRPDRHIGWRSFDRPQDPTVALRSALQQVLSRQ